MRKAIILMIFVALLAATLLPGCSISGLGAIVSEKKDFTGFTSVDVDGTFDVEITRSESFSTTITVDESLSEYIAVSKEGETLRIYLNPRNSFTDFTLQAKTLKAKITMPALYGLRVSGASKATVSGFDSTQDFNFNVSGASSLKIDDIKVSNLEGTVSGASQVSGSINSNDVKLVVSGASKVNLKGLAKDIILTTSGASKVDLTDFPMDNADVNLSGASEATLHIKGKLNCVVSAASSLYFLGNPTMGNVQVTGASTIKHK